MKVLYKKKVSIFLLFFYLYTSLLIAGGKGPFTLYDDFWICHCSDTETELSELDAGDLLKPDLVGLARQRRIVEEDPDICRAPRSGSNVASGSNSNADSKVCQKKLPLRYLNAMLTNISALRFTSVPVIGKPVYAYVSSYPEYDAIPVDGYASLPLRPPIS
jgi:hypothetical protein